MAKRKNPANNTLTAMSSKQTDMGVKDLAKFGIQLKPSHYRGPAVSAAIDARLNIEKQLEAMTVATDKVCGLMEMLIRKMIE